MSTAPLLSSVYASFHPVVSSPVAAKNGVTNRYHSLRLYHVFDVHLHYGRLTAVAFQPADTRLGGNQLCSCAGALPFLKPPRRLHRMLRYAIRIISAFLGDLMTNAPYFGNQRTVFHFRFPKVRFSRKVCGVMICGHLKPAFSTIWIVLGNVCGFAI